MKPYPMLVRLAVRGLIALGLSVPLDVQVDARGFGLDPELLPPRFISPLTAQVANLAYPGLFGADDMAALAERHVPITTLDDL